MSKVIQTDVGFAFQRSVIGPEKSHHSLNQSDAKQEPITTWSPAFFLRFQINKLIKQFFGNQRQLQEIISHQISLFGVIQLLESIKKKKIQFSIRMLSSFREKPRKNEWSDTFFEAYKWF